MRVLLLIALAAAWSLPLAADELQSRLALADVDRGRLVFGPCRTCHYPESSMGHNSGPNLSGIFGKVAGKQPGFKYYSRRFRDAEFVWTPQLMYAWLENPMAMFPDSVMMSRGVPDPQDRADLIAYLKQASLPQEEPGS
ncbi:adenylate cyclase [Seongchinamella sediminis]|uniref:Adenylate cyclase n=1 Tax=Seongchinamella sediminis TaxID=2283635 RepID=A0A3L7DWL1_9GAMM|nr:c-type cytochrome [Seongchinamella sediminis]RLQ21968.1 adenylate cyclase [Seongchinamella sediminis]